MWHVHPVNHTEVMLIAMCQQTQQRAGETIYKGHRSYDLMLNLQLGIRCSVSRVASEAPCASLEPPHFQAKVCCPVQMTSCHRLLLAHAWMAAARQ